MAVAGPEQAVARAGDHMVTRNAAMPGYQQISREINEDRKSMAY
jgi:hypothetical protein